MIRRTMWFTAFPKIILRVVTWELLTYLLYNPLRPGSILCCCPGGGGTSYGYWGCAAGQGVYFDVPALAQGCLQPIIVCHRVGLWPSCLWQGPILAITPDCRLPDQEHLDVHHNFLATQPTASTEQPILNTFTVVLGQGHLFKGIGTAYGQ